MAFDDLPRHIAFICDGNSRWSEQQQRKIIQLPGFLPSSLAPMSMSTLGHAAGAIRVVHLIDTLLSMRQKHYQQWHQQQNHPLNGKKEYYVASIKCCTLFTFSTDNWSRPYQEVAGLLQLLEQMMTHYSNHDIVLRKEVCEYKYWGTWRMSGYQHRGGESYKIHEVKRKVSYGELSRTRRN